MQKKLTIRIATPCDEDWTQMTEDGQGRYCSHCQKTVIDFRGWDNVALYDFFSRRKDPVCGRFRNSQLNSPLSQPPQHNGLHQMAAALGLVLLFSGGAATIAHPRAPFAFAPHTKNVRSNKANNMDDTTVARGFVFENMYPKTPAVGASVKLLVGDKVKYSCHTDSLGCYYIPGVKPGLYKLTIEKQGFIRFAEDAVALPNILTRNEYLIAEYIPGPENDTNIATGGAIWPEVDTFNFDVPLDTVKPAADKNKKLKK